MDWYSGSGYCLPIGSLFPGSELIGGTMKHYKKTITILLTAAVLLVSVFMTGCTSLTEPKNSTPSETDAPAESDGFGVYVKLGNNAGRNSSYG